MGVYKEEDFYKNNGSPTEEFSYCSFSLPASNNSGLKSDYDQFALVINAFYPYIRLARIIGNTRLPCGSSSSPASDGSFAKLNDLERDARCPKIVWGLAAIFVSSLKYSDTQQDYVLQGSIKEIYRSYYDRYWRYYESNHNGLKLSGLSIEQKELYFLSEHLKTEKELWKKSLRLRDYGDLFDYAQKVEAEYERFVLNHKQELLGIVKKKNDCFSTQIRSSFDTDYVKVFFLDDSVAPRAQEVVQRLNSVRVVNLTRSESSAHPGLSLTVYPKPMVTAALCERQVIEALNSLFSGAESIVPVREVKTDAYFDHIEKQVIDDLDGARVSIYVAMAWFTNQKIADKLVEKFKEGLDIKVVAFDDHTNAKFGVALDGIPYVVIKGTRGGIMHNKFCVIDNQKVLTGSYNWSTKAENKNDESVSVIYADKHASDYSVEFRRLFALPDREN